MATYIKIAPQDSNRGGIASKGYQIYRRSGRVTIKWGAIISVSRKFYWAGKRLPQIKIIAFKSLKEATSYWVDKIGRIKRQDYKKLPAGKKILKYKII